MSEQRGISCSVWVQNFSRSWNYHPECALSFIPCFHACYGNTGQNLKITVAGLPSLTHTTSLARGVRHHCPLQKHMNSKLFRKPWGACRGREHQGLGQWLTPCTEQPGSGWLVPSSALFPFLHEGWAIPCPYNLLPVFSLTACFRTGNFILTFPSLDCDKKGSKMRKTMPKRELWIQCTKTQD